MACVESHQSAHTSCVRALPDSRHSVTGFAVCAQRSEGRARKAGSSIRIIGPGGGVESALRGLPRPSSEVAHTCVWGRVSLPTAAASERQRIRSVVPPDSQNLPTCDYSGTACLWERFVGQAHATPNGTGVAQ